MRGRGGWTHVLPHRHGARLHDVVVYPPAGGTSVGIWFEQRSGHHAAAARDLPP